jgi:thiol-disulfide isomerase/thioredoxin
MKKILLFGALFLLLPFIASSKGYNIKVKIKNVKNDTIYLAHYYSKSIYPDDTLVLDKNGEGVFKGDKSLPGGLYIIYLPNKQYFDFLIDNNQTFAITNDTSDFLKNMVIVGDVQNQKFLEYQRNLQSKREEREKLDKEKADSLTKPERKEKIEQRIKELTKEVVDYQKRVIKENPGTFLSVFLNALLDIEVPDPPVKEDGTIDSAFQYYYYRNHYLDNFDLADARLLRTPLYENKLMQYLNQIIPQVPDTIIKEIDVVLNKTRNDSDLYRFNLVKIFNHFAKSQIMGYDAIYIHLAENYYLKDNVNWADSTFLEKLREHVIENKPTLIGNITPDIELIVLPDEHFVAAKEDSTIKNFLHAGQKIMLHQIEADYVILAFWEKDCGHCRKTIPELHKLYLDELRDKKVVVIAYHTLFGEEGKVKWVDFVNEHQIYGWVNAWNPYSYKVKELYNVKSTPMIFVLDKDKRIVAKRIGPPQAVEIIDELIKRKNRNK